MFRQTIFDQVTYIVDVARPLARAHQDEYDKRLPERLRALCDEVAKEAREARPLPLWHRYVDGMESDELPGGEPTGPDATQPVVVFYPPDRSAFCLYRGGVEWDRCMESYAVPGDPLTGRVLEAYLRGLKGAAMVVCTRDEIKLCRYRERTPGWVNVCPGWANVCTGSGGRWVWQSADGELFDDETHYSADLTGPEWDGWDAKVVVHRLQSETEEEAKRAYPGLLESSVFLPEGEPGGVIDAADI